MGGSETYVKGLLGAFADGNGPEEVNVMTSGSNRQAFSPFVRGPVRLKTIDRYRTGESNLARLAAVFRARALHVGLAREVPKNLDLVHYPVTVPIPDVPDLPRVVTLLDVQHLDMPELFSKAELRYRRWAYDGAARNADAVITISDFSARRISDALGIPANRVHGIHLGVDHARFNPEGGTSSIASLPDRYLYYPANAWPHKNHRALFEAMDRLQKANVSLVLSGSGAEKLRSTRAPGVIHLGRVSDEEVPGLMRGALGLVFPSLYEGFGLPPLEAMACGCPVLAASSGAVAEVCGEAALYFDPRDPSSIASAIEELGSSEEKRARLVQRGIARAAGFTWANTASRHAKVYDAVLADTR